MSYTPENGDQVRITTVEDEEYIGIVSISDYEPGYRVWTADDQFFDDDEIESIESIDS